VTLSN